MMTMAAPTTITIDCPRARDHDRESCQDTDGAYSSGTSSASGADRDDDVTTTTQSLSSSSMSATQTLELLSTRALRMDRYTRKNERVKNGTSNELKQMTTMLERRRDFQLESLEDDKAFHMAQHRKLIGADQEAAQSEMAKEKKAYKALVLERLQAIRDRLCAHQRQLGKQHREHVAEEQRQLQLQLQQEQRQQEQEDHQARLVVPSLEDSQHRKIHNSNLQSNSDGLQLQMCQCVPNLSPVHASVKPDTNASDTANDTANVSTDTTDTIAASDDANIVDSNGGTDDANEKVMGKANDKEEKDEEEKDEKVVSPKARRRRRPRRRVRLLLKKPEQEKEKAAELNLTAVGAEIDAVFPTAMEHVQQCRPKLSARQQSKLRDKYPDFDKFKFGLTPRQVKDDMQVLLEAETKLDAATSNLNHNNSNSNTKPRGVNVRIGCTSQMTGFLNDFTEMNEQLRGPRGSVFGGARGGGGGYHYQTRARSKAALQQQPQTAATRTASKLDKREQEQDEDEDEEDEAETSPNENENRSNACDDLDLSVPQSCNLVERQAEKKDGEEYDDDDEDEDEDDDDEYEEDGLDDSDDEEYRVSDGNAVAMRASKKRRRRQQKQKQRKRRKKCKLVNFVRVGQRTFGIGERVRIHWTQTHSTYCAVISEIKRAHMKLITDNCELMRVSFKQVRRGTYFMFKLKSSSK